MRFGKELNQALKILWVFAVITFVFRLIQRLSSVIFFGINGDGFTNFLEINLIWLIAMSFIIAGLYIYIKKIEGVLNLTFIHDPTIRITSGLLIVFEGIYNLLISVPVAFSNIITFHQITSEFENTFATSQQTLLISNVIPSLLNLLQVLIGLYLVVHKKHDEKIRKLKL